MNERKIILDVKDLTSIEEGVEHLKDIAFNVEKGKNIVFFGPENSGLSILFPVIMGLQPYSGEVNYKGKHVIDFDYIEQHNYKKEIGYLHHDLGLISNMSAEKNISLPLEYHSEMSTVEIKEYVDELIYELNLDYCKKFRPVDLSSSESLRTAYARAIVLDPDILLVEYAFESQSPMNVHSFRDILKKRALNPEKSILFISYDPYNFLDMADYFIMLFNGSIVFQGDAGEMTTSDNPYLIQYRERSFTGPMVIL